MRRWSQGSSCSLCVEMKSREFLLEKDGSKGSICKQRHTDQHQRQRQHQEQHQKQRQRQRRRQFGMRQSVTFLACLAMQVLLLFILDKSLLIALLSLETCTLMRKSPSTGSQESGRSSSVEIEKDGSKQDILRIRPTKSSTTTGHQSELARPSH